MLQGIQTETLINKDIKKWKQYQDMHKIVTNSWFLTEYPTLCHSTIDITP